MIDADSAILVGLGKTKVVASELIVILTEPEVGPQTLAVLIFMYLNGIAET